MFFIFSEIYTAEKSTFDVTTIKMRHNHKINSTNKRYQF